MPESRPAPDSAGWEFINKGSRYMLLDNVSKGLEPLLVLLCAKLYAGGDWGFFKYFESLLLLLMRLAVAGLDRGVVWIYWRRSGDAAFARVFARAVNFVFLAAVGLALLAAAQRAGWLPSWSRMSRLAEGSWLDIACYLASLPLQAATLLFVQGFLNKRALFPVLLIRNVAVPGLTLAPAVLLAFTPLKPHGLALPYLLGSLAGLVLSAAFFFRIYALSPRDWALRAWVPKDLIRFSLPLASTDFFMSLAYRVDILLLGRYMGLQAVEVYAVIIMLGNTLRSIRQSFDGILLSVFSSHRGGGVTAEQRRNFNYATWIVLTLQIPFLPLAILFGRDLLGLLSPAYAHGGGPLVAVLCFNLAITVTTFYSQMITGMGRTWFVPGAQVAYFLASLGFNFLLIPRFGLMGAALATGSAALVAGAVSTSGIVWSDRSLLLQWAFMGPVLAGCLWFLPALAAHALAAPALVTAPLFAAGAAGYAWAARRHWRGFNAPRPGVETALSEASPPSAPASPPPSAR